MGIAYRRRQSPTNRLERLLVRRVGRVLPLAYAVDLSNGDHVQLTLDSPLNGSR